MKILVSGLINIETTVKIEGFPLEYYPITYPFFGVNSNVSGVGYNISKALRVLGDDIYLVSMTGNDFSASYIKNEVEKLNISFDNIQKTLTATPSSVILYDSQGKRQIHCDLKDIQEQTCFFNDDLISQSDIIIACNINYNRGLIKKAKALGKIIATDVHVLSDIYDSYNSEFMEYADILFLSDENIKGDYKEFLKSIENIYHNKIIVLGMGDKGALMYLGKDDTFYHLPAVNVGEVVNTVGAGDSLFSSFIHYYAKGYKPIEALKRAEIFASYKIGFNGASNGFPTEEIVENLYNKIFREANNE